MIRSSERSSSVWVSEAAEGCAPHALRPARSPSVSKDLGCLADVRLSYGAVTNLHEPREYAVVVPRGKVATGP